MSALHHTPAHPGDEAAMARVLAAERDARQALEQSTREAAHAIEQAHAASRAISARAARRIATVRAAMERRMAARLAEIDVLEVTANAAGGLEAGEREHLARAVELLAAELSGGAP